MTAHGMTTAQRFWMKVDTSAGPDACWPWLAGATDQGYGLFKADGRCVCAHRWAYEGAHGAIPEGYEVDHVRARGCTRRDCVNPAHLEAVTMAENQRRRHKTHCKHGHAFTPENTYVYPLRNTTLRVCRACRRLRKQRVLGVAA
jgi:hypothetical protein